LCDCEGILHDILVFLFIKFKTNCLGCGKIVCDQERYGPCFFCNQNVQAPKTIEDLDESLKKAIKNKDRLVEVKNFK
jgi:hypothetical protein